MDGVTQPIVVGESLSSIERSCLVMSGAYLKATMPFKEHKTG